MNEAVAGGLFMVLPKLVLRPKTKTACFTIYCVSKVILRYLPFYLGYSESKLMQTITNCNIIQ